MGNGRYGFAIQNGVRNPEARTGVLALWWTIFMRYKGE